MCGEECRAGISTRVSGQSSLTALINLGVFFYFSAEKKSARESFDVCSGLLDEMKERR